MMSMVNKRKIKFNLSFASVQAEREMEKNAKHRQREKSCKGWLETNKHILYELKCINVFKKNSRTNTRSLTNTRFQHAFNNTHSSINIK